MQVLSAVQQTRINISRGLLCSSAARARFYVSFPIGSEQVFYSRYEDSGLRRSRRAVLLGDGHIWDRSAITLPFDGSPTCGFHSCRRCSRAAK